MRLWLDVVVIDAALLFVSVRIAGDSQGFVEGVIPEPSG
jgi:hypothetical protein